ncbi:hypothetical protein [Myxosarcina sp. GI1(2024)]
MTIIRFAVDRMGVVWQEFPKINRPIISQHFERYEILCTNDRG